MIKLVKIFLIVAVLGGVAIYFVNNPPAFLSASPNEGKSILGNFSFFPKYSAPSPNKNIQPLSPPSSSGNNSSIASQQNQISDGQIPSGFNREDLSPYFRQVTLSSVSARTDYNGNYSATIQISYSIPSGEKRDITGWRMESNRGQIFLPQAVNIYEPNGLNNESNIIVSGSGRIAIYRGRSPINRSFRLNKCTGYLQKDYNFNPSLPLSCPTVNRADIINFSGQCQSYIMSLGSCRLPDVNFYNSLPGTDQGNQCRAFLSGITFNSCFQKHQGDADFFSNEWRVWMDFNSNIFDAQHDRVLLFDKNGLLVSELVY